MMLRLIGLLCVCVISLASVAMAHEGFHHRAAAQLVSNTSPSGSEEAEASLALLTTIIGQWPTPQREELVSQAWLEHQFIHGDPKAPDTQSLANSRAKVFSNLRHSLPTIELVWDGESIAVESISLQGGFCRTLATPLLIQVRNDDDTSVEIRPVIEPRWPAADNQSRLELEEVEGHSEKTFLASLLFPKDSTETNLRIEFVGSIAVSSAVVEIPIALSDPGTIRGTVVEGNESVPARVTVVCSDGICRSGGVHGERATFATKPIIYPPIGGWQRSTFFYTDGSFEVSVPPGATEIMVERGFHHQRCRVTQHIESGRAAEVVLLSEPLVDMTKLGWISGDTHVHWVTNAWNVDEPLELLSMAQRAEGLHVANNLTLLQRYADQAFIKPSQAPMGPIDRFSNDLFHMQMGEEYRNEDLYGHLCFLNIDWLVQPIGTGSIIAGPDALDYPLNKSAIEACHQQGGISIEAHGTGGNKDVPVNVIHNLTDALDQMEPDMYYRLLDCGFRLPLTNGSDHPARILGSARAYVKVEGEFSYSRWIESVRQGRTFTTSGPLIFLSVNHAELGDVITADRQQPLEIEARVVSRDPIGHFQIISNSEVIAETQTDERTAVLKRTLVAGESRWIVARCSNRSDGRAEWGFGNFNAITGPGIAHTSPVYVEVDRLPRFVPDAAKYWQEQIRLHIHDVQAKGRFATQSQRSEAINYLESGMHMYGQLPTHIEASRAKDVTWQVTRDRMVNVLLRFRSTESVQEVIHNLKNATSFNDIHDAVQPLVLMKLTMGPHDVAGIDMPNAKLDLHEDRPERFLIEVSNGGGARLPLHFSLLGADSGSTDATDVALIDVVDSPFTSRFLSGANIEYKVAQLTPHRAGIHELRVVCAAGIGAGEVNSRPSARLMLEVERKRPSLDAQ